MLDELYTKRLLAVTANISHIGELADAQARATAVSKLCGSEISVDLSLDQNGHIGAFAQRLSACALGQTSAAIVAQHIEGTSPQEFHDIARIMRIMLKENGPAPKGRWADLSLLEGVRTYSARHASTLLVFDAVEDCLAQLGV